MKLTSTGSPSVWRLSYALISKLNGCFERVTLSEVEISGHQGVLLNRSARSSSPTASVNRNEHTVNNGDVPIVVFFFLSGAAVGQVEAVIQQFQRFDKVYVVSVREGLPCPSFWLVEQIPSSPIE